MDKNIAKNNGLNYVRLPVQVEIRIILLDKVYFMSEKGLLFDQKVTYEWTSLLSKYSKKYCNVKIGCRKK